MLLYEKDGKLNISFSNSSKTSDISLYKDGYGQHAKVGNASIDGWDTIEDINLTKVEDYLYEVTCDKYDLKALDDYFNSNIGYCSSCRNGNFYGRNYDWLYDDRVEFIVNVLAKGSRHASIGVSSGTSKLTKDFIESGENDPAFNLIPLMMLDGINDCGVTCNINVVPRDFSVTTGTNPGKRRLNIIGVVRYILDNATSATNAISLLSDLDIWCPSKIGDGYEIHLMVADIEKTFVVEFIDNKMVVLDLTEDIKIMTNFHIWDNGNIRHPEKRQDLTPHGSGYERYAILKDGLEDVDSVVSMQDLMHQVNFSLAYEEDTDPIWYSELVHGDLVNNSPDSAFDPIMERAREFAKHKERNGVLWQTVHTSVFDLENFTMTVNCQENSTDYEYSL